MALALGLVALAIGLVAVAGELKDPQRSVPLALLRGTALVMLRYIGLNAAFLARAPWETLRSEPEVALAAAKAIFGGGQAG